MPVEIRKRQKSQPVCSQEASGESIETVKQRPESQQTCSQQQKTKIIGDKKDWACHKCGKINFAKKTNCKECNEPRKMVEPAKVQVPGQQQQTSFQPSSSQSSISSLPSIERMKISGSSGLIESSPDGRVYEGTRGQKCNVEVNYGVINFKNLPQSCFHYDVSFNPDATKKMWTNALEVFMKKFFKGYIYGFDGRKNMYTAKQLERNGTIIEEFTEDAEAHLNDRSRVFKITIKYAATVDLSVLLNYKNPMYQNEDKPSKAIQALDIIIKSAYRASIENNIAIPAGRAIFFVPDPRKVDFLGDGMELWYGL